MKAHKNKSIQNINGLVYQQQFNFHNLRQEKERKSFSLFAIEKSLKVFFVLFFIMFFGPLYAQQHTIENVEYRVLDEKIIVINYDLLGKDKKYLVELTLKRKQNPLFELQPTAVAGDIGKGKFAGIDNKIVWSMENEQAENFYIDPFVNDFYFEIRARRKNGWGWFFLTVITGGVALVIHNQ